MLNKRRNGLEDNAMRGFTARAAAILPAFFRI